MDNKIQHYQRKFTLIKDWDKSYLKQTAVNHFTTVKETIHNPNDCETHTNWQDRNQCSCILPFVLKQNNGKVAFTNFKYADYVGVDIDTTKLTDSWDLPKITEYVKNLGYTALAFYSLTENHYKLLIAINRTYNINEYRALRNYINNILPFADDGYKGHQTFIKGYIKTITTGDFVPCDIKFSSPKIKKVKKTHANTIKPLKIHNIADYSSFMIIINKVLIGKETATCNTLKKYGKIEYVKYNRNNNTFNIFIEGESKSKGSFFFSPGKSIKIYKGNYSWMPNQFLKNKNDNTEFYKILRTLEDVDNRFLILNGKKNYINDYDNAITDIYNHKIVMSRRLRSCGVKRYQYRKDNKRIMYFMYQGIKYFKNDFNQIRKLFYKIKDKMIDTIRCVASITYSNNIMFMINKFNLNISIYKGTLASPGNNPKPSPQTSPSAHKNSLYSP